jgi:cell wall-associated NlpC family hydrolase
MKIELFQKLMLSFLNIPYIYGGKNPLGGEDCSGLVCEFLKALGKISTNDEFGSQQLYNQYKPMTQAGGPVCGSLAFYGQDESHIDHVAMFLDSNFIVEAGHGTADTTTREVATQRGAFSRVRPHSYRADLVDILNIDLGLVP